MLRTSLIIVIFGALLAGCKAGSGGEGLFATGGGAGTGGTGGTGGTSAAGTAGGAAEAGGKAVAFVEGRPITVNDLQPAVYEAAGGQILAEMVLDRRIERRLAERGITLAGSQIMAEKEVLLKTLDAGNEDQATRLLRELRKRRGLGDQRFEQLLKRNAGLRALIAEQVQINDALIQQAHQMQYGAKYEIRLITVEALGEAGEVARKARDGTLTFTELAVRHSTDSSRAQGGLLPPISPVDESWPEAIRKVVTTLNVGSVSDPVALERGFAIVKLERKVEAQPIQLEPVRAELTARVRRNAERLLMQQLARTLLTEADVLVADRVLRESWTQQKELMFSE